MEGKFVSPLDVFFTNPHHQQAFVQTFIGTPTNKAIVSPEFHILKRPELPKSDEETRQDEAGEEYRSGQCLEMSATG
jgi:hypothetical protein